MFMILHWLDDGNILTCVRNEDGSIRLFSIGEADALISNSPCSEDLRIISIEEAYG